MDIKETFQKAFLLVKNPKTWCKDFFARTTNGDPCDSFNSRAASWCSTGALEFVSGETTHDMVDKTILNHLNGEAKMLQSDSIIEYNDMHSHSEVVKLWKTVGERNKWL